MGEDMIVRQDYEIVLKKITIAYEQQKIIIAPIVTKK